MLINRLSAINMQGDILNLPLDDTAEDFVVQDIQGLGPAKATLVSSGFASIDGGQYHTSRLEPRNLVIKLGLAPAAAIRTVYDLRAQLYGFFMPKTEVTLKFNVYDPLTENFAEQNRIFEIKGRVESFEVEQFVKDPTVDLSVMCFEPAFKDPASTIFDGLTTFTLDETVLDYKGTVETGFLFSIFPNQTLTDFSIYHRPPNQKFYTVSFNEQLVEGDRLDISSVRGHKHVTLIRNGAESKRLYSLSSQSSWLELHPGLNLIRVYASTITPVPYIIEYKAKYGGL